MSIRKLLVLTLCGLLVLGCKDDAPRQEPTPEKKEEKKADEPEKPTSDPKDSEEPKTPEEPKDPQNPGEPKDPQNPEEPKDPEKPNNDPADPKEPEKPNNDPADPKEPEKPNNDPADPKEPEKPNNDPADPKEPEKPNNDPADPKEPEKPNNDPVEEAPEPGKSKVIMFDFTGQGCTYCHSWLESSKTNQVNLAPNFIVVNLHCSAFSTAELYRQEAAQYFRYYGFRGVPSFVFNGDRNISLSRDQMINLPDILDTKIESRLTGNRVDLSVRSRICKGQSERIEGRKLRILLWITEDEILASQKDGSGRWIQSYQHEDIFRGSLNGMWGEEYQLGTPLNASYTLPEGISNPKNLELVMMILDDSTRQVMDVERIKL